MSRFVGGYLISNLIAINQRDQSQFVLCTATSRTFTHIFRHHLANGKLITKVSEATEADVDRAVEAAQKAIDTTWGLNASGAQRAELLKNLGDLMVKHKDELSAIEALDNGKTFGWAKGTDVTFATEVVKYYAGWADKIMGDTIETDERKLAYTRHEPIGVVVCFIFRVSKRCTHYYVCRRPKFCLGISLFSSSPGRSALPLPPGMPSSSR